ncbi:hypothetical protein D3C71_1465290 [compost metagenome]
MCFTLWPEWLELPLELAPSLYVVSVLRDGQKLLIQVGDALLKLDHFFRIDALSFQGLSVCLVGALALRLGHLLSCSSFLGEALERLITTASELADALAKLLRQESSALLLAALQADHLAVELAQGREQLARRLAVALPDTSDLDFDVLLCSVERRDGLSLAGLGPVQFVFIALQRFAGDVQFGLYRLGGDVRRRVFGAEAFNLLLGFS